MLACAASACLKNAFQIGHVGTEVIPNKQNFKQSEHYQRLANSHIAY